MVGSEATEATDSVGDEGTAAERAWSLDFDFVGLVGAELGGDSGPFCKKEGTNIAWSEPLFFVIFTFPPFSGFPEGGSEVVRLESGCAAVALDM
jgi:hypothetical protein